MSEPHNRVVDLSEGPRRRGWFGRKDDGGSARSATLVRLRPAPRDVPSTEAALEMACDWMRYFAFSDSSVAGGPQPLINSSRGLAHLISDPRGVHTSQVMEVHKVASLAGKYPLVFALGGFSAGAIRWADTHHTALFEFDARGQVRALSATGRRLLDGSDQRHLTEMSHEDLGD